MNAQRTMIVNSVIHSSEAVVLEAMKLVAARRTTQRWVCEACGMVHTGAAPKVCDSCGLATALVQQAELHCEMHNRW